MSCWNAPGRFLDPETVGGHLRRGAKRVIVAAPVKFDSVLNVVVGVNHHLYDPARTRSSPRPPAPPTASPRW
jgi:glyceraldehyde-3-phosphate dehydrogenase/erythrose-4-phosphate dehydrogenase